MFRASAAVYRLASTTALRCGASSSGVPNAESADGQAASQESSRRIKEQVEEQLDREVKAMSRVASYPHQALTRVVLPATKEADLKKIAQDLNCVSFSAPKGHWDCAVILVKSSPDDPEFDVWVNPEIPGYDDRNSVAPMYGMWENCISCGVCHAWVLRPQRVTCKGLDQHGNEKMEVLDGMRARCVMHEMDHLRGKTIFQQALGPEFVVSGTAMAQRDLWPVSFPSAEAYSTPPHMFFDYIQNNVVIPKGLEWWHAAQNMQHFDDQRIDR